MSKRCFLDKAVCYSGAGNDFLVIDDRKETFPILDRSYISSICSVDGILLLQKQEESHRMRILNKDGSEAESCGNGLRCLAKYILDEKIPTDYRIWMHDRWVQFFQKEDHIGVNLGVYKNLKLNLQTENGVVHFVDTGVPHAIQFVLNPQEIDLNTFGPWLRHHPIFQPKGTNASVAKINQDGEIEIRTFERGVEGETLACGTAAAAVAVITRALFRQRKSYKIHCQGGQLEVSFNQDQITLFGPAKRIEIG